MARDLVPNQFGDDSLSADEAASACGPAAAVAFARAYGRAPTLREAVNLAKKVGWTTGGGMNGVGNQKRLLDAMGVPSRLSASADLAAIKKEAATGNPVTISTSIHYYVADDYDPKTGQVHVGNSGRARRNGGEWMTLEQIAERDGGINGVLYMDHPDTGGASTQARPPVQRAIDAGKKFISDAMGVRVAEAAEGDDPPAMRTYRSGSSDEVDPNAPVQWGDQGGDPVTQSRQTAPAGGVAQGSIDPTLARIVQAKGEWTSKYAVDPEIPNPAPKPEKPKPDLTGEVDPSEQAAYDAAMAAYKPKLPNPNPTYRYVWDDNTHVDVKAESDGHGGPATYTVIGGTALAALSKAAQKDKEPPKVQMIDGKPYVWDEASSGFKPAPGLPAGGTTAKPSSTKQLVTRNGKSYVYDSDTGAFTPATGLPDEVVKPDKPTVHVAGNRVVTVGPDGQLTTTVIDPEAQALATQQAQQNLQQGALNIQKSQQALLPEALLAIKNHAALIVDLHKQVADPTSALYGKPELADQYIAASKAYTDAALQGATPFQLQKQREDNERMSRQQGVDLINQRLSSGSALASNLTNAAAGLAQHSLFAPGQTSFGVDPLAIAKAYTTDMGGGPEVSDFAKRLLMSSQPQHAGLG